MSNNNIKIINPSKEDSKGIYKLIKRSKPLDLNSEYLYLLQTIYFNETCMVAKDEGKVIGFVSGFITPRDQKTFFVWQVAVDGKYRGKNIAFRMLKALFDSKPLEDIQSIETTISPSNIASQRVFEKFAGELDFDKEIYVFATKSDFEEAHEDELLYMLKPKIK
ncbi:MAG: diaminobutyrate acetyltransferase [Campylobacterales bacterium]|nr:diaminobutyrate acetyltransferase [Campylobacterales bacterium]